MKIEQHVAMAVDGEAGLEIVFGVDSEAAIEVSEELAVLLNLESGADFEAVALEAFVVAAAAAAAEVVAAAAVVAVMVAVAVVAAMVAAAVVAEAAVVIVVQIMTTPLVFPICFHQFCCCNSTCIHQGRCVPSKLKLQM